MKNKTDYKNSHFILFIISVVFDCGLWELLGECYDRTAVRYDYIILATDMAIEVIGEK